MSNKHAKRVEEEKPSIKRAKENYKIIKETMREFKQGEKKCKN